jgi:hypothetical protein
MSLASREAAEHQATEDGHWRGPASGRPIAELTGAILTPAKRRSVAPQSASVTRTRHDAVEEQPARDGCGCVPADAIGMLKIGFCGRPIAKFAM